MFFLFWRHRENILRLDRGEEMPWLRGKKKEQGA
jgi:glycerol-3-phosphate acyltransferase PlsY